jgi:hypothetical protein
MGLITPEESLKLYGGGEYRTARNKTAYEAAVAKNTYTGAPYSFWANNEAEQNDFNYKMLIERQNLQKSGGVFPGYQVWGPTGGGKVGMSDYRTTPARPTPQDTRTSKNPYMSYTPPVYKYEPKVITPITQAAPQQAAQPSTGWGTTPVAPLPTNNSWGGQAAPQQSGMRIPNYTGAYSSSDTPTPPSTGWGTPQAVPPLVGSGSGAATGITARPPEPFGSKTCPHCGGAV